MKSSSPWNASSLLVTGRSASWCQNSTCSPGSLPPMLAVRGSETFADWQPARQSVSAPRSTLTCVSLIRSLSKLESKRQPGEEEVPRVALGERVAAGEEHAVPQRERDV